MDLNEKRIKLEDIDMLSLLGYNDEYLHLIENKFESIITARGNAIILRGKPQEIKTIETVFNELIYILKTMILKFLIIQNKKECFSISICCNCCNGVLLFDFI